MLNECDFFSFKHLCILDEYCNNAPRFLIIAINNFFKQSYETCNCKISFK